MTASFAIEDATVNAALAEAGASGSDTRPLMNSFASAMLTSVQRRFETESGPDGRSWTPLRPRTANARIGKRRRGAQNMLRVRGQLYRSITAAADDTVAQVGTNTIYAGIHQGGGEITQYAQSRTIRLRKVKGRTRFAKKSHKRAEDRRITIAERTIRIPARPYLGFSDADRAELLAIAARHFVPAEPK